MSNIVRALEQQVTLYYFPIIAFFFVTYFLYKWLSRIPARNTRLPPSPPKLPFIGNLHQLSMHVHHSCRSLAQRYDASDFMLLHFGSKPVLVVTSSNAAREMMKTNDLAFSGRPKMKTIDKLLYNSRDVASTQYGDYWRQMRSVFVLHLLSNRRVQSYRAVRAEEISCLIQKIQHLSSKSLPVNLSQMVYCLTNDVISRIAFGRKYGGENDESGIEFQELMGDFMKSLGTFSVGEFIPWLGWINWFNGFDATVDRTAKGLDKFVDSIVEEHVPSLEKKLHSPESEDAKDFVHVLLELQKEYHLNGNSLDRDSIKALILDVYAGGSDTSSTLLEWAMTELIRNPNVMKELQNEVRRIAQEKPNSGNITEDDLGKMSYLKMVIKEALRLHPPFPLLAPRETIQDVKLMGYDIPLGTMVLTNFWAIARDPKTWTRPEEFWPERFMNSSIDFKGQDFELIPFGAGRRGCPGIPFAMPVVELALANLVKNFDWKLPDGAKGEDLDVSESVGITTRRKDPLLAVAIPISDKH